MKQEGQMDPDRDGRVRQSERHPTLSPTSLQPGKLTWWGPTVPGLSSLDTDHGWLLEDPVKFRASKQLSGLTQNQGFTRPDQFMCAFLPLALHALISQSKIAPAQSGRKIFWAKLSYCGCKTTTNPDISQFVSEQSLMIKKRTHLKPIKYEWI